MKRWFGPMLALVWKDILLETRTKDVVLSLLVFSTLVIVVFSFAVTPTPETVAFVAPGVVWVAVVFGGVLGLTRSFALEKERGGIHGLMLAPIGRDTIFFGKALSNFFFMLVVEALVFPLLAVLFNLSLAAPWLIPIAGLATLGIATVGTVFAAMAVNTRAREVMLPLLFLPVVLPTIVAAVEASGLVLRGGGFEDISRWLSLLVVFDAVFLVACPLAFHMVVED